MSDGDVALLKRGAGVAHSLSYTAVLRICVLLTHLFNLASVIP